MRRILPLSLLLAACATAPKSDSAHAATAAFDPMAVRTCLSKPVGVIGGPQPEWPTSLMVDGRPLVEGEVLAQFWVLPDGRVYVPSIRFLRVTDPAFAKATLRVIPHWRFAPALASAASSDSDVIDNTPTPCRPGVAGQPAAALVQLPFTFAIRR
jgi:hypothetical protein